MDSHYQADMLLSDEALLEACRKEPCGICGRAQCYMAKRVVSND